MLYAVLLFVVGAGIESEFELSPAAGQFTIAAALLLAAAAGWFTGVALNRKGPRAKVDRWVAERRVQLDSLVDSGRFSLGPGQPQPRDEDEAQEMADALLISEQASLEKTAFNHHQVFFIPMQWFSLVWVAFAIMALVNGFTKL